MPKGCRIIWLRCFPQPLDPEGSRLSILALGPGAVEWARMWEHKNTRQDSDTLKKRWFYDSDCDLILWQDAEGAIKRFQFCYDKGGPSEKSVEWRGGDRVFAHDVVNPEGSWDMGSPTFANSKRLDLDGAKQILVMHAGEMDIDLLYSLLHLLHQKVTGEDLS